MELGTVLSSISTIKDNNDACFINAKADNSRVANGHKVAHIRIERDNSEVEDKKKNDNDEKNNSDEDEDDSDEDDSDDEDY
jgi:hypothetical protein